MGGWEGRAGWQVLAGTMSIEHTGRPAGGPRGTILCLDVKGRRSIRLTPSCPCRSLPAREGAAQQPTARHFQQQGLGQRLSPRNSLCFHQVVPRWFLQTLLAPERVRPYSEGAEGPTYLPLCLSTASQRHSLTAQHGHLTGL